MIKVSYKNASIITLIIFVAYFLRLYQLNFEDYWIDEMLSFYVADPNITLEETLIRQKKLDQNPLLFNFFLQKYFQISSYDPEIGRHVSFFCGLLVVPLLGILSYQVKKDSYLLAILLFSLSIYLTKYSQETRPYSLIFLLSTINLIFFYKIIFSKLNNYQNIFYLLLFVIFSVLSLSSHPFVIIILFSQIVYSVYAFYFFKKKNYLFIFSIPLIIIIYIATNYNYLLFQLADKTHFLTHEGWDFYYNYYFSRFFGSKIMGFIYLSSLIFLIVNFRKKILFTQNRYLPLVLILFFSYIIPLLFGLIRTPILTDRYIIFVLIPIIILISSLSFEIDNKKIKKFLLIFIIVPTIINHFIEINFRVNTKPEFNRILNHITKSDILDISLNAPGKEVYRDPGTVTENYLLSLNTFKKNKIAYHKLEKIPPAVTKVWIICYQPIMGFDCSLPEEKFSMWNKVEKKKLYLIEATLYKR